MAAVRFMNSTASGIAQRVVMVPETRPSRGRGPRRPCETGMRLAAARTGVLGSDPRPRIRPPAALREDAFAQTASHPPGAVAGRHFLPQVDRRQAVPAAFAWRPLGLVRPRRPLDPAATPLVHRSPFRKRNAIGRPPTRGAVIRRCGCPSQGFQGACRAG